MQIINLNGNILESSPSRLILDNFTLSDFQYVQPENKFYYLEFFIPSTLKTFSYRDCQGESDTEHTEHVHAMRKKKNF